MSSCELRLWDGEGEEVVVDIVAVGGGELTVATFIFN
jgi:hypothetical protein